MNIVVAFPDNHTWFHNIPTVSISTSDGLGCEEKCNDVPAIRVECRSDSLELEHSGQVPVLDNMYVQETDHSI